MRNPGVKLGVGLGNSAGLCGFRILASLQPAVGRGVAEGMWQRRGGGGAMWGVLL